MISRRHRRSCPPPIPRLHDPKPQIRERMDQRWVSGLGVDETLVKIRAQREELEEHRQNGRAFAERWTAEQNRTLAAPDADRGRPGTLARANSGLPFAISRTLSPHPFRLCAFDQRRFMGDVQLWTRLDRRAIRAFVGQFGSLWPGGRARIVMSVKERPAPATPARPLEVPGPAFVVLGSGSSVLAEWAGLGRGSIEEARLTPGQPRAPSPTRHAFGEAQTTSKLISNNNEVQRTSVPWRASTYTSKGAAPLTLLP